MGKRGREGGLAIDSGKRAILSVAGAGAAGFARGGAWIVLFHPSSFDHQVLLAFVLGGMVGGRVPQKTSKAIQALGVQAMYSARLASDPCLFGQDTAIQELQGPDTEQTADDHDQVKDRCRFLE
jgi:hypothetical protein